MITAVTLLQAAGLPVDDPDLLAQAQALLDANMPFEQAVATLQGGSPPTERGTVGVVPRAADRPVRTDVFGTQPGEVVLGGALGDVRRPEATSAQPVSRGIEGPEGFVPLTPQRFPGGEAPPSIDPDAGPSPQAQAIDQLRQIYGDDALIADRGDGTFQVSLPGGGFIVYGMTEAGQLFEVDPDADDPGNGRGAPGTAAPRPQFLGTDPRTGEALFMQPNGTITRGEQIGFREVDPLAEFAQQQQEFRDLQALREGEFARDVFSQGRNFVTAGFLTRGATPPAGSDINQADMIRAGTGGRGFNLSALGGGGGTATPSGEAQAQQTAIDRLTGMGAPGFVIQGLNERLGQTTGATAGPSATNQADILSIAREFSPPAVTAVFEGEELPQFRTQTPLASPRTLGQLTEDERGALNTRLQLEEQITLPEFEQASRAQFLPQSRRAPSARMVA